LDRTRRHMEGELKARGAQGAALDQAMQEHSKDILRERIDQLLLVQKGKEIGINVESEVSKWMAELQDKSGIVDTDKFQSYIREQTGMSFEDYKSDIRNGILTQRVVRQEVGRQITIPRAELEKYYNEHKSEFMREDRVFLRQILISTEGKDAAGIAAAEKKVRDIAARAKKGEKFHELAKQYSDDTATKQNYGELGGFKRGELNKQIEPLVFNGDRGFVTDPIRVSNGWVILKVEEKHKAGQASLEEVENEVMERLYTPKFTPQVRTYLTQLRNDAFLEIKPGFVDTGAAEGKDTAWTDPAQLKPETVTKEEVQNQTRRRRLLWMIPIPGTQTSAAKPEGTSSSK
jgi:peptidyl-prolyl cis-trans isomerase SurA